MDIVFIKPDLSFFIAYCSRAPVWLTREASWLVVLKQKQ